MIKYKKNYLLKWFHFFLGVSFEFTNIEIKKF